MSELNDIEKGFEALRNGEFILVYDNDTEYDDDRIEQHCLRSQLHISLDFTVVFLSSECHYSSTSLLFIKNSINTVIRMITKNDTTENALARPICWSVNAIW